MSTPDPADDQRQVEAATQDAVDNVSTAYTRDAGIDVEDRLRGEMASRGLEVRDEWCAEVARGIRSGHHLRFTSPGAPGSLGGDNGGA